MRLERLRLSNFRNYRQLDLALPAGLIVLRGRNAQGKSNLLEAISLLATSRSFRTSAEREVVLWHAAEHFARIEGLVARRHDEVRIEVLISDAGVGLEGVPAPARSAASSALPAPPSPPAGALRKRIRVNGVPRRAMDLIGVATVVVFAPSHLDLVTGPPAERRRFLDLTLCQVDSHYCRELSQYQKVLTQRAALLRRIRDGEDSPQALDYWDELLARLAAPIMRARQRLVAHAEGVAARVYAALARDDAVALANLLHGGVALGSVPEADLMPPATEDLTEDVTEESTGETPVPVLRLVYQPAFGGSLDGSDADVAAAMRAQLVSVRRREIAQGTNVLGPQRDDLLFLADGMNLATYGSRGQQRSVALALKLAELAYIESESGEQPILLLDDVLSELDAQRRHDLIAAVSELDQVLITLTDATHLPPLARERAQQYRVQAGQVYAEQ